MASGKILYPDLYRQMSQRSTLFRDLPDRLKCSFCGKIMIEPTQTECGCRFCLNCIKRCIKNEETECPSCGEKRMENEILIGDRAVEREMIKLEMKCINIDCGDVFLFGEFEDHLSSCEHQEEKCGKCAESYPRSERSEHLRERCDKSEIVCGDCGRKMKREEWRSRHRNWEGDVENVCEMWLTDCVYRCDEERLFSVRIHMRTCPKRPRKCRMEQLGCRFVGPSDAMNVHEERDGRVTHEMLMMTEIVRMRRENEELRECYREKERSASVTVEELRKTNSDTSADIQKLAEKLSQMEVLMTHLSSTVEGCRRGPMNSVHESKRDVVVYNGGATWTIRDIRRKMEECDGETNSQIVSDTFYVTNPGYNLSMKVYLRGDGRAKNQYLSAFFVINRGVYDNEISWPFQSKVTLSLLGCGPTNENVIVQMKPDNNAACYGRPLSDCNVGAGQPEFVRLSEILSKDSYLHDGALKLRLSLSVTR